MKCTKCSHEIHDDALFCGYCGNAIKLESVEVKQIEASKKVLRKKRTGKKWLIFFIVLAIMSGGLLGFLVGKGIVDWRKYIPTKELISFTQEEKEYDYMSKM